MIGHLAEILKILQIGGQMPKRLRIVATSRSRGKIRKIKIVEAPTAMIA
jgi:hypothetical protein